ncbi:FkbM family methyltransferase [Bacillus sp. V3B]|uniref:FkbM family methyltransferase n=1 Tax=Bacillus sp. V3B TaxID=2804915 RepID=UPI00210C442E|nr:FkbM family methyltransferase [Bacillus sp. V3B]MCQ6274870.1 FkbM family methyltransferase [Bacillus sp. V3B]
MPYYSQIGQDKYTNEKIFKGMENGFFVDVGAHDGIELSNSYFFEKVKGWKGICIEPLPEVYKLLKKNRNCICIEGAISTQNGYQDFLQLQGDIAMLSGLENNYDNRHRANVNRRIKESGQNPKIIKVQTFPLQSVLNQYNVTHIDLLSIDTEGSELQVLQSINYNKVKIECIILENGFNDEHVRDFLSGKGFKLVKRLSWDDVYLHKNSKFSHN